MNVILNHVDIVRADRPLSISEGPLAAAIVPAKAGEVERCLSFTADAGAITIFEASPFRLMHGTKMKAIALDGLGRNREAEEVVSMISSDPLGMEYARMH